MFMVNGCVAVFEEAKPLNPGDLLITTSGGAYHILGKSDTSYYYNNLTIPAFLNLPTFRYGIECGQEISIETMLYGLSVGYKRQIFNRRNFYASVKTSIGAGEFIENYSLPIINIKLLNGYCYPKYGIYWGIGGIYSKETYAKNIIGYSFLGISQHISGKRNGPKFEIGYFYNYKDKGDNIVARSNIYAGVSYSFEKVFK